MPLSDLGSDIFSVVAYIMALSWMTHSVKHIQDKNRYFWLFFSMGICFLLFSKLAAAYYHMHFMGMRHSQIDDLLRLVGYLFFFTGFIYQIKGMKNTLPMLRFLFNIIIVIITVNSVSWYFIVNPILKGNHDLTQTGFLISSIYHVLNISLLFASICLVFLHDKTLKAM